MNLLPLWNVCIIVIVSRNYTFDPVEFLLDVYNWFYFDKICRIVPWRKCWDFLITAICSCLLCVKGRLWRNHNSAICWSKRGKTGQPPIIACQPPSPLAHGSANFPWRLSTMTWCLWVSNSFTIRNSEHQPCWRGRYCFYFVNLRVRCVCEYFIMVKRLGDI